jgi:isopenicillin-N N-acyltransferase-like protein
VRALRTTALHGAPRARGHAHGEAHAAAIRAYAEERVHLAANGTWAGRPATPDDVLSLARRMLPHHEAYDRGLHTELLALAEAAGISPEAALVAGGFTDIVDTIRNAGGPGVEDDDCTAVLVPPSRTAGLGGLFAQTWDMHDSATPHVVLLDIRPDDGPAARVFSTVGCLGQIGVNEAGITVGINNLVCTDGRIGVTWNFVVRRALAATTLEGALAAVREAGLAGGHNYLLMDRHGRGVNVECSARVRVEETLAAEPIVHTNHCVHDATRAAEAKRDAGLLASSRDRLRTAQEALQHGEVDVARLQALMAEKTCICRHSAPPGHIETSGALVVRPATGELWATWGPPDENPWERFTTAG